jgi:hypothetical protein
MVLKCSVFKAEINKVNVGLNGKMNEILMSKMMAISDLVSPIIYKISNCYHHIFTVSVSVFLCVSTDITGGCR